ncbi:hypothetical protein [Aurantiacibacter luteus]|uniref:Lipoprotein n=1 Tax=Aurantiacibacter luteus TaxID=1581420 RepID=A0A0G9N2B7_9SPHN|nr:hypothetical protein [Aurantiacibacter luteus]KLE35663.1 hypothetical protein AAW00_04495 [Aurantiacibacter luteus]
MRYLPLPLFAALALSACATTAATVPSAEGTPVPLGQAVALDDMALTPLAVVEDSRCPINARCVWAGRIVVQTRVAGRGWQESAPLTLGEPAQVHGRIVVLVSAEPGKVAGTQTRSEDYRFVYEGRGPD